MNPWILKPSSMKNHLSCWLYQRTIINRLRLSSLHYQWNGSHRSLLLDHNSDVQRRKLSYLSKSIRKGKLRVKFSSTKTEQLNKSLALDLQQTKQFSLIHPRSTTLMSNMQTKNPDKTSSRSLLPNLVVLLKNYISLSEKVEIVNICQEVCLGPRGFYEPTHINGGKLGLHMMCFGRNWDPKTKYDKQYKSDGSEAPLAPPIHDKLVSLVERSLQDSRSYGTEFPLMQPDVCVVNFYTPTGRLAAHQNPYGSGLHEPIVLFSIGDSAEFVYVRGLYCSMKKVLIESGDVLIFDRSIDHGVKSIIPNSAPLPLLNETMLRPGCLNLTFMRTLKT